tara:strand:- start:2708 stop:3106 length:399 start_codon:yes stop_codon:yes gene_type:complete
MGTSKLIQLPEVIMLFGEYVREARQEAGLSLANVAEHLGVTKVYVSDVERGLRPPFTQERLSEIAVVLGLNAHKLSQFAARNRDSVKLPLEGSSEKKVQLAGSLGYVWPSVTEKNAERILNLIDEMFLLGDE